MFSKDIGGGGFWSFIIQLVVSAAMGIGIYFLTKEIDEYRYEIPTSHKETVNVAKAEVKNVIDQAYYNTGINVPIPFPKDRLISHDLSVFDPVSGGFVKTDFLLLGKFIRQGEMACIVAGPGVGKTYLACFLAKRAYPLKTVYFSLDRQGSSQLDRIKCIPSVLCIDRQDFESCLAALYAKNADICQSRAIRDTFIKYPAQIEDRFQKYMKETTNVKQIKIDEVFLFELLVESALCQDADIIILDSLNGLLNYEFLINRKCIDRITSHCQKMGKTLILLHHTNKQNEIAGHSSLSQVVDTVIQLDLLQDNYRRITVKKSNNLQGCNSCVVSMISIGTNNVCFMEVPDEKYKQRSVKLTLEKRIIDCLQDKDSLPFDELFTLLGSENETSVKNYLKRLEEKGYVSKADGKTWDVIKNCMNNNTIA